MGRRWKGPPPDDDGVIESDVEVKDRVFFEKPKLLTIGKAEPEPVSPVQTYNTQRDLAPVGDPDSLTGPVRLASSRTYAVCSNRPSEVTYMMSQKPTYDQIKEYLRVKRIDGFGTGAVVARRYANEWRAKSVHQWGIVLYESGNPMPHSIYAPYVVRWFENGNTPVEEKAWAEDLIVIHTCLDQGMIEDIIESQGIVLENRRSPV